MKPLQAPPAQNPSSKGMAYPFNYIIPQAPSIESVMRKMFPAELGPLSIIPGSGPAPVMMRFDEWLQVSAHFLYSATLISFLVISTIIPTGCSSARSKRAMPV